MDSCLTAERITAARKRSNHILAN